VNDCWNCNVYDNGDVDNDAAEHRVILFWIGRPDSEGKYYSIIEETLDGNTINCLTTSTPDMLWLKGTVNAVVADTKAPVVDLTDFPDLASLQQPNQRAIDDAQSRLATVGHSSVTEIETNDDSGRNNALLADVDAVDTSANPSSDVVIVDDISTITKDEDDHVPDEAVTIMIPEKVLKSEKQLVSTLSNLNDLRKKVYVIEIQVGGHRVKLQTFHYPEINLEAPINKIQRTYIDPDDVPTLFSYEFKSALTTQVKVNQPMILKAINNTNRFKFYYL
jgi:hypothetical protein